MKVDASNKDNKFVKLDLMFGNTRIFVNDNNKTSKSNRALSAIQNEGFKCLFHSFHTWNFIDNFAATFEFFFVFFFFIKKELLMNV